MYAIVNNTNNEVKLYINDVNVGGDYTKIALTQEQIDEINNLNAYLLKYIDGVFVEGESQENIDIKKQDEEYLLYLRRKNEGIERFLYLSAEFRYKKQTGQITQQELRVLESELKLVRDEFVNGQFISAKEELESIGASVIGQELYDRLHLSITEAIQELYP